MISEYPEMAEHCRLQNDALDLEVAALGAEMQYLRTAAGDDLLWHGDPAFWTGRAPVLFPIVGRAVGDVIATGGHSAPMSQHGFARRSVFELQEHTDLMCRHTLTETVGSLNVYPFAFELELIHHLEGATLHLTAHVKNTGDAPMPFGFGFHPAFCWPLPNTDQQVHHVTLAPARSPQMRALQDGLLERAPISGPFSDGDLEIFDGLFSNGALVFPDGTDNLRYGTPHGPALTFEFNNLPDLALWRPVGAPFLCIEPWHGTASYVGDGPQISERPNSITLEPDAVIQFGYSVTVEV